MSVVRVLTVLLILGLSLGLLQVWNYADAPSSSGDATYLLYIIGLVVLIVLISAIPRLRRIGPLALVMILAVTGYAYRSELQGVAQHVLGALMGTVKLMARRRDQPLKGALRGAGGQAAAISAQASKAAARAARWSAAGR
jgi:hypothetical protein